MTCRNCTNEFEGNYCNNCGQKKITKRLNIIEVFISFFSSFNLEGRFLLTLRLLFIYPNIILNDYILGKRKTYYDPVKFFIITLSISAFLVSKFSENKSKDIDLINSPFWLVFSIFILVPFFSFLTYILNRKKHNYTENIVVNLYLFGVLNLFSLFSFFLRKCLMYFEVNNLYVSIIVIVLMPICYLTMCFYRIFRNNVFYIFIYLTISYLLSLGLFILLLNAFNIIEIKHY